ncbi:hypothetical protein C0J52_28337, partial [Blattella germanica]
SKVKAPKTPRKRNIKEARIACSLGLPDVQVNPKALGRKECRAADLTYEDMTFYHHVNSLNKIDQDNFLLKHMEITSPKRKRVESGKVKRKHAVSVKYRIRKKDGHMLPVCAATFQGAVEYPQGNLFRGHFIYIVLSGEFHFTITGRYGIKHWYEYKP